jgi:hypothetical protein
MSAADAPRVNNTMEIVAVSVIIGLLRMQIFSEKSLALLLRS